MTRKAKSKSINIAKKWKQWYIKTIISYYFLTIIITKWGNKKTVVGNKSQRPEIIGTDAIKTQFLGGYFDIMAGSVTLRSEPFLHGVSKVQKLISAPLNTMDSFLLDRGLQTLDVRMQRHG